MGRSTSVKFKFGGRVNEGAVMVGIQHRAERMVFGLCGQAAARKEKGKSQKRVDDGQSQDMSLIGK